MKPFAMIPCNVRFVPSLRRLVQGRKRNVLVVWHQKKPPVTKHRQVTDLLSSAQRSDAVLQLRLSRRTRALNATVDLSIGFYTVPNDSALAMWADWRQRMNRALEAIECVMFSGYDCFKGLVIFIFTNFAYSHTQILSRLGSSKAVSDCFERVEITQESDTFP
jgi:hypothetical protein